jgi:hypothetical protein
LCTNDKGLTIAGERYNRIHDGSVPISRYGNDHNFGFGDQFLSRTSHLNAKAAFDDSGRREFVPDERTGTFAGWRPNNGLMTALHEKSGVAKRNAPASNNSNFHRS